MNYETILNQKIQGIQPSGIRKFFDILEEMKDAISLGIGEPDFVTPWHIRDAGIYSLERGYTKYTSNAGMAELRREIASYLDRRFGLKYPCLSLPEEEQKPVGIWGQRHLRYIKEHKRAFYTNLLISCKLNSYLADIDKQAEEMFSLLVKQLAEKENVTEKLKAENQMLWVQKMNNIRSRATEIINTELIYA